MLGVACRRFVEKAKLYFERDAKLNIEEKLKSESGVQMIGELLPKIEVWCDPEMSWCQIKVFSTSPQSACTRPSRLAKTKVNGLFSNLELN